MLIDCHAHILPGADHGSPNLAHSLNQIAAAKAYGVSHIIATPHFYSGRNNFDHFLKRRELALKELTNANTTGIEICAGAEVQISSELPRLDGLRELAVQGTNTILLELPPDHFGNDIINTIIEVQSEFDLHVVIAHIDRYPQKVADLLMEQDIDFQVNAEAMCSFMKRGRLIKMIKNGNIKYLGSDVHTDYEKSYDMYKKASERILKEKPEFMKPAEMLFR